jgi:hypothetical protein
VDAIIRAMPRSGTWARAARAYGAGAGSTRAFRINELLAMTRQQFTRSEGTGLHKGSACIIVHSSEMRSAAVASWLCAHCALFAIRGFCIAPIA